MNPQTPAEGILKQSDYGEYQSYTLTCECAEPNHDQHLIIEADDNNITVTIYSKQYTNSWDEMVKPRYDIECFALQYLNWRACEIVNGLWTRLKLSWQLWFKGEIEYQSSTILTEQQAINYANVLIKAVEDVKNFKSGNHLKSS